MKKEVKNNMKKKPILGRLLIFSITSLVISASASSLISAGFQSEEAEMDEPISVDRKQIWPTIQVQVSKWVENDTIETTNETWPYEIYIEFMEEINGIDPCGGGGSSEQYLAVFQEYSIIPQGKTMEDLENFLAEQYVKNQEIIEELIQQYGKGGGSYQGTNVWLRGKIEGPFTNFHISAIFYTMSSDYGGSIEYSALSGDCGSVSASGSGSTFHLMICIWVGIFSPHLIQFIMPFDTNFAGIAGYTAFEVW